MATGADRAGLPPPPSRPLPARPARPSPGVVSERNLPAPPGGRGAEPPSREFPCLSSWAQVHTHAAQPGARAPRPPHRAGHPPGEWPRRAPRTPGTTDCLTAGSDLRGHSASSQCCRCCHQSLHCHCHSLVLSLSLSPFLLAGGAPAGGTRADLASSCHLSHWGPRAAPRGPGTECPGCLEDQEGWGQAQVGQEGSACDTMAVSKHAGRRVVPQAMWSTGRCVGPQVSLLTVGTVGPHCSPAASARTRQGRLPCAHRLSRAWEGDRGIPDLAPATTVTGAPHAQEGSLDRTYSPDGDTEARRLWCLSGPPPQGQRCAP